MAETEYSEEEFDKLSERLGKLQPKNRRETLFKLKELYPDESGEIEFANSNTAAKTDLLK